MRVPRLFLKAIVLMAGSMTSLDHPDELSDSSYGDRYEWLLKFEFYSELCDSWESFLIFLLSFLPQF
jgi:hypothetical protein